jgi:hypothetical protein
MAAANTYTQIPGCSITVGTAVSSVTFSSIPSTYTDLIAVIATTTSGDINYRINSDTGSNYSQTLIYAYSSFGSTKTTNATSNFLNYGSNNGNFFATLQFNNYSNTTTNKISLLRNSANGTSTDVMVGLWRSTAAINSITFNPPSTFATGSTFNLYGITAA